jgi:hypothetical protein
MSWSDILETDLSWREAELASLKRLAIINSDNEIILRTLLRAAWTLLYAHYEGFSKFSWDILLDVIEKDNVEVNALIDPLKLLALESVIGHLKKDLTSTSALHFFTTTLPARLQSMACFTPGNRLETDSNLWPNVFERECRKISVHSEMIVAHREKIKALVSRRNDIAHGKTMTIASIEEYTKYESATLLVMHDLAVQVLEAIESKSYRKV